MLDHVSIPVADLERAARFYDVTLEPLGLTRTKERPNAIGYGPADRPAPCFWLLRASSAERAQPGVGLHISFEAPDRTSVDGFFDTAVRHGARSAGAPGPRREYTQPFYGAFVLDLDGFKVEAVCRREG
ncbi:MAG: VOC family protein [Myxococcota bacterium]